MFTGAFACDSTEPAQKFHGCESQQSERRNQLRLLHLFLQSFAGPCTDGTATVPSFASVILESHSAGAR